MMHIVLFEPQIPQNTGNIARTCAITNSKLHLIRPLGFSIDEKSVKRAGLDYWSMLDLEVHDSFEAFLDKYQSSSMFFSTTKAQKYYHEVEYKEDSFIIFGSETKGLPNFIHERFTNQRIKIPMVEKEGARSLNLSNSVAIVLYEALRQTNFSFLG
jgi:tRNA (cytidine/uridine-2'-O-)-methyltransferase